MNIKNSIKDKIDYRVIEAGNPNDPEVIAMMTEADVYYANLYPPESNHLIDSEFLSQPNVSFYIVRINGSIMGFGALVNCPEGYGEIKRMYVKPESRKLGIGLEILQRLEQKAAALGLFCIRLETGIRQPEAIGLYRSCGYKEIPSFGLYLPDPLSLFMEKLI